MNYQVSIERWPLREPFVISRETIDTVPLLRLTVSDGERSGVGEAVGVDYRGEEPDMLGEQIAAYLEGRSALPEREELLRAMPAGGARNALDCALWDLEAKREGARAWTMIGWRPARVETVYTISLGDPDAMAEAARAAPGAGPLKLKLGGGDGEDFIRVDAVSDASADRELLVDVNEGWSIDELNRYAPLLADLGVKLIEQPLPADADAALADYCGAVPLCADESFDDMASFATLSDHYAMINVKLDKCGGLTAGLACVEEARRRSLGVFVGCMLGTSLGMAPAMILAGSAAYADLDGPLLLKADREPGIRYDGTGMMPFPAELWG